MKSSTPLELTPDPAHSSISVDFRRSLPPIPPQLHGRFAEAFQAVAREHDLGRLTHESIPRGAESDREAGARWLSSRFQETVPCSRMVVTSGTQSAILVLLRRLVGVGGLLVAERLSYGPLRLLAESAGVRTLGLDIDEDGIRPDSFEAACRQHKPNALYCNPTVQNPTTAIMPRERRLALAEIARRFGVAIIEDDALGMLHPEAPQPIAAFAPDITWYVMTTTKCLAHGLRLAYLVMPAEERAQRVIAPVEHLSYWHPTPLLAAMTTQWINSGVAAEITGTIHQECISREQAARKALAGFDVHSKPGSMHIWLDLPQTWRGREFMHAAERRGVLLRSAEFFAVDDQCISNAIRLSLSTPPTLADVRRGLEALRTLLDERQ